MNTFTQLPKTLASLKAANGLALRTAVRAGVGDPAVGNHNQANLANALASINTNSGLALRTAIRAGVGGLRPENPSGGNSTNHNQSK